MLQEGEYEREKRDTELHIGKAIILINSLASSHNDHTAILTHIDSS